VKIAFYRYLVTLIVVAVAAGAAWLLYQKYVTDPWTRDCQVRANIVGIAPRVSGPIINIPVHDNQEVKAGDLLFEIDPADYKTALDSAKASVANAEANVLQKQQDLDRETDLFQRKVSSKKFETRISECSECHLLGQGSIGRCPGELATIRAQSRLHEGLCTPGWLLNQCQHKSRCLRPYR
jgi:multidrug resistance efflux pump